MIIDSAADELLGAFAKIYQRASAAALADAFVGDQLVQVQLNLSALGLPTIPDADVLETVDLDQIGSAFVSRGRVIWGVSATYNAIHPDPAVRHRETAKAAHFIGALRSLGPVAATLCSGTRDPDNMWRAHPDNTTPEAWSDLRGSLDALLPAAEHAGILLAIEPEPGNVVAGTAQAVRLINELGGDAERVGIILDPANLVYGAPDDHQTRILKEAFELLGAKTICVHAKDAQPWTDTLRGSAGLDYQLISQLYDALPQPVPMIIQDATEAELPRVRDWIRAQRSRTRAEAANWH